MRARCYSLKEEAGKLRLDYSIGLNIQFEDPKIIHLKLSNGEVKIFNKYEYVNKFKIVDDGNKFFFICDKAVDEQFIFDKLIDYACNKIACRIDYLEALKANYKKQKKMIAA